MVPAHSIYQQTHLSLRLPPVQASQMEAGTTASAMAFLRGKGWSPLEALSLWTLLMLLISGWMLVGSADNKPKYATVKLFHRQFASACPSVVTVTFSKLLHPSQSSQVAQRCTGMLFLQNTLHSGIEVGMCTAADAIFPKQLAKSPMPPVTPVPGRRKHKPLLTTSHFLTAAPSCTLEIPSELEEGDVWEHVRSPHRHLPSCGVECRPWLGSIHR